jgi:hypothetical protein
MPKIPTIVKGDLQTVLRLPPSEFVNRNAWTQEKSDMLAHFIQVAGQISRSSWMRAPCDFQVQGGKVLGSHFPTIEAFVYGTVYFRQLYAGDKLFSSACNIYAKHAGDPLKVHWAKEELAAFERLLAANSFFFDNISLRDLIDAFLYGALIFHGPEKAHEKHKRRFQSMITRHPREELLYSLDLGMRNVCRHATDVSHLVYKDMAHWQHREWIPAPNVWWHSTLFGSSPPSTTGNP